jgi:hypothetical protein
MADLTEAQKLRIVIALAQFETLTEISKAFGAEGIDVKPNQIATYDPTRLYAFEAGEKWRKVFEDERQRYITEVSAVPIANQGYRLQQLQQSYEKARAAGNRVLANATLRQAAEEVGGALTNERNVKVTRPLDEVSADERRTMFAELISKALEAKDPPGAQSAPKGVQ